jgi:sirohydrochlorin cobaltochelatase
VIAARAAEAARRKGRSPSDATLVLLTHGSRTDPASRNAAEDLADRLRARRMFSGILVAVLEGGPDFAQTVAPLGGPVLVVGLFAGEGLHGAGDVPSLVARTADAAFVGNVGAWPEIADVVAAGVRRALRGGQAHGYSTGADRGPAVFGANEP